MIAGVILAVLLVAQSAAAQPAFTLNVVTTDGITEVSLTSESSRLSAIAAELSKRVGARVVVGSSIQQEPVRVTFSSVLLEPALMYLAPRVYIDYEIRQNAQPVPQTIYLLGLTDPDVELERSRGPSQALLIEGHTEETTDPRRGDPLLVSGDQNRITIASKQQPLSMVLMAVREVLGVPIEIRTDGTEIVDANLENRTPEDALTSLSPNIRVIVRANVSAFQRGLLRIVVVPPSSK